MSFDKDDQLERDGAYQEEWEWNVTDKKYCPDCGTLMKPFGTIYSCPNFGDCNVAGVGSNGRVIRIDNRPLTEAEQAHAASLTATADKKTCRCECGYTCDRKCGLPIMECMEKHYVKDCDHDFTGWEEFEDGRGGTSVCACGVSAMGHDMAAGP